MDEQNPFYRPEKPKNSWELLKWVIFEPILFKEYEKELSKKEMSVTLLKAYSLIILILLLYYLMTLAIIIVFDLPSKYPEEYNSEFITDWNTTKDVISKSKIYFKETSPALVICLAFGLASGLVGEGVAKGLTIGLAGGLALCLGGGVAGGLTFGLTGWLASGLAGGLGFGLAFTISFYFFYFRVLPFYPVYAMSVFLPLNLTRNPYLTDAVIWLPIYGVKPKLLSHGWAAPNLAFKFADFLLEYRPLQRKLAFEIIHTATAATWYHHLF